MKILLLVGNEEFSKGIRVALAGIRKVTYEDCGVRYPYAEQPINSTLARVKPDLIIMKWEEFGENTLATITRYYQLVRRPPVWVLTESHIGLISWKAQEASLLLNIQEHFSTDVLRALVRRQAEHIAALAA